MLDFREMTGSELSGLIVEALERSAKALDAAQIHKALPTLYRAPLDDIMGRLHSLEGEGKIWKWGEAKKPRYSAANPSECARQHMLDVLRGPLSGPKLKEVAGRRLEGYPSGQKGKLLTSMLRSLVAEGAVIKLPRRGEQYSRPPAKAALAEALATIRRDYANIPAAEAYRAFEQIFGPEFTLEERIERAVLAVEPRARTGGVAWAPDVRARLSPPVEKEAFDAAILGMARNGLLHLHEFSGHLQVSEEQRRGLVFDGQGKYYGGIAFGA
jgi:hypothetical protein